MPNEETKYVIKKGDKYLNTISGILSRLTTLQRQGFSRLSKGPGVPGIVSGC